MSVTDVGVEIRAPGGGLGELGDGRAVLAQPRRLEPVIAAIAAKPASIGSPCSQIGGKARSRARSPTSAARPTRRASRRGSRRRARPAAAHRRRPARLLEHGARLVGARGGEEQRGVLGDVQETHRQRDRLARGGREAEPVPAREDVLERLLDARAQGRASPRTAARPRTSSRTIRAPWGRRRRSPARASSRGPPAAGRARRRRGRTRAPRPGWWGRSGRRRRGARCRRRTAAPPRARSRCSRRRAAARRSRCRRARRPTLPRARRAGPRARRCERRARAAARCRGRWRSTARRRARRRGSAARLDLSAPRWLWDPRRALGESSDGLRCRRRDSNPRHADYDWRVGARFRRR